MESFFPYEKFPPLKTWAPGFVLFRPYFKNLRDPHVKTFSVVRAERTIIDDRRTILDDRRMTDSRRTG
jgi:hypothetical protein